MREKNYSTEAIILGRKNSGEADRIINAFTKRFGKIKLIAKGIRKPKSRKKSALELFTYVKLFVTKGKNLDIITDAQKLDNFSEWRKDLLKVGIAYHWAEIVDKLTREGQEQPALFDLLLDFYKNLSSIEKTSIDWSNISFKRKALEILGFLDSKRGYLKNLDSYIEKLINGRLKTKRFLENVG